MSIFQAIFLGVVQGITEVLPISSSGHLILMPWLFNFKDPGLSFDVALHLGTLFAILSFFHKEIIDIAKGGIGFFTKKDPSSFGQKLFVFLAAATIPGVLAGVLLEKYAENTFRNPLLIAGTTFVFGLILYAANKFDTEPKSLEKITFFDSLIIGISQAVAIIPGVSRSGITISAGLFRKLKREDAARFSFLLSAPIILGAAAFQLKDLTIVELSSSVFIAGFFSALLASFLSIKFLLNYIRTHNFNVFVYYRIILAMLIVGIYLVK